MTKREDREGKRYEVMQGEVEKWIKRGGTLLSRMGTVLLYAWQWFSKAIVRLYLERNITKNRKREARRERESRRGGEKEMKR